MSDSLAGLLLAIGATVFLLVLALMYFGQNKLNFTRSKIYRILFIIVIYLSVTGIFNTFFVMSGVNENFILVFRRLHWLSGPIVSIMGYYYFFVLVDEVEVDKLSKIFFYNKSMTIGTILFIIEMILFCFLKLLPINRNEILYYGSALSKSIVVFSSFCYNYPLIYLFSKRKKMLPRVKWAIITSIIFLDVIGLLQSNFPFLSLYALMSTIEIYILYYNIENPDLYVIDNYEQLKIDMKRIEKTKNIFLSNISSLPLEQLNISNIIDQNNKIDVSNSKNVINKSLKLNNDIVNKINNIINLSNCELGTNIDEKENYSIIEVVNQIINDVKDDLNDKDLKLSVEIEGNIPRLLKGNKNKIYESLLLIINNAIKDTVVGKIIISLAFISNDDKLVISVIDSSDGFDVTSVLNEPENGVYDDTYNFNLIVANKYVNSMNGNLIITSDKLVGSKYMITLNQEVIDSSSYADASKEIVKVSTIDYKDCSGKNVLIVDDNASNANITKKILSKYNFNVEIVNDAQNCLYNIKLGKNYDLIFTDDMMGDMSGVELLKTFKGLEGYSIPPVIVLTANRLPNIEKYYADSGFHGYLEKPINAKELDEIVNVFIK